MSRQDWRPEHSRRSRLLCHQRLPQELRVGNKNCIAPKSVFEDDGESTQTKNEIASSADGRLLLLAFVTSSVTRSRSSCEDSWVWYRSHFF